MCSFSNYGNTCVDLFAPGGNISSCYPSELDPDGITTLSGTSMAAPFVTGVAALILSAKPNTTASALKSYLLNNTDYCNAFAGKCATNGRLNAYKALFAATHIHSYTHHYSSVGSTGHKAYCACGAHTSQVHSFSGSGSVRSCTKCGYSIALNNTDPEIELQ